jgi:hypothetical protein
MGRAVQQSNPTEMTHNWVAAGDDAVGWYSSSQTYDWKGRPLVTTNQDGTTKEASYGGCGCAGGAVATVQDEIGRRQRTTSDVFGRAFKSEVLKPDGSIYSATLSAYNARDQVTAVESYRGAATSDFSCPTGTCMQSLTTYDGYGRVAAQKLPQQSVAGTYAYNADDTVQSVTDPRGVVATNSYNSRHLLTGVTYSAPSGIVTPAPVSFSYDSAGNRTLMSDGTGSISYAYDTLSHLTIETRTFAGLSGQYPISYAYNLSGSLTSISDHTGASVNYWYDQVGRLSIMPAGSGYTGVTNFISNMQYRAFGAPKHATYGNGVQVNLAYNSRMQIGQYQVSGFQAPSPTMGATMSYYADGRTNLATDLNDARFDRKYDFDFSARLTEGYSGVEAHGQPPPPLNQANSPYRQSYTYDEWNNVVLRSGRIWSTQSEWDAANYGSDNRRQGWSYDAAGNALTTADGTYTYDAAGRPVSFVSWQTWQLYPNWPPGHPDTPALETQDTFDGTGQVAKHIDTTRTDESHDIGGGNIVYWMSDITTTTYYVHSTVLGGKTLVELSASGSKTKGYVYAGGARVATQDLQAWGSPVTLECTNPVTGASVSTPVDAYYLTRKEPDPLGRDLAQPPDPTVVIDPLATSKWNEPMPIEYTGGPSAEYGVPDWYVNMANAQWDMNLARNMWTIGRRDLAQEILARNPNVGIIATGQGVGQLAEDVGGHVVNGVLSLWGEQAAYALGFVYTPKELARLPGNPQNTQPLNADQRDIADLAGHAAGNILAARPECAKYVTDGKKVNVLKLFGKALRELRYDPNLDLAFPAETDPGVGGTIRLGRSFFSLGLQERSVAAVYEGLLGMDVVKELGRAINQRTFILLHEFKHSATGKQHKTMDEFKGWLKGLYENCFKPK